MKMLILFKEILLYRLEMDHLSGTMDSEDFELIYRLLYCDKNGLFKTGVATLKKQEMSFLKRLPLAKIYMFINNT